MSGEAPAEFELIDEFAESPDEAIVETAGLDQPPEPDSARAEASAPSWPD